MNTSRWLTSQGEAVPEKPLACAWCMPTTRDVSPDVSWWRQCGAAFTSLSALWPPNSHAESRGTGQPLRYSHCFCESGSRMGRSRTAAPHTLGLSGKDRGLEPPSGRTRCWLLAGAAAGAGRACACACGLPCDLGYLATGQSRGHRTDTAASPRQGVPRAGWKPRHGVCMTPA